MDTTTGRNMTKDTTPNASKIERLLNQAKHQPGKSDQFLETAGLPV
jgi:hypothetical protein